MRHRLCLLASLTLLVLAAAGISGELVNAQAAFKPRSCVPGADPPVTAPFSIPGPGIVRMKWIVENYQSAGFTRNWPVGFRKRGTDGFGPFPCSRALSGRTLSNGVEVTTPVDGKLRRQFGQKIRVVIEFDGAAPGGQPSSSPPTVHAPPSSAPPDSLPVAPPSGSPSGSPPGSPPPETPGSGTGSPGPEPSGTCTIGVPPVKDAHVSKLPQQRDQNFGNHPHLATYSSNCNDWTAVSYLEFPIVELPKSGLVSARIVVQARASHNRSCGVPWSADPEFALRRVTSGWDEGTITYNRQPTFDGQVVARARLVGIRGVRGAEVSRELTFDVTGLYRRWVEGGAPNFGIRLSHENGICQNCTDAHFLSRHGKGAPRLIVTGAAPPSGHR
ncbi:MAG: DNRLRE domain-containing protein [Candidatus Riflebacteria bacterium]|nr:DNRLRE domain-containing protein [Candidatus Riflebacteria bacterium]